MIPDKEEIWQHALDSLIQPLWWDKSPRHIVAIAQPWRTAPVTRVSCNYVHSPFHSIIYSSPVIRDTRYDHMSGLRQFVCHGSYTLYHNTVSLFQSKYSFILWLFGRRIVSAALKYKQSDVTGGMASPEWAHCWGVVRGQDIVWRSGLYC